MKPHARQVISLLHVYFGTGAFKGAEVGVFRGHTSREILQAFPLSELIMVDSFNDHEIGRVNRRKEWSPGQVAIEAESVTEFARERRTLMKMESLQAAARIPNLSLDFVFLDASHYYEDVKNDIYAWWPKIKEGGLLIGHDYGGRLDRKGVYGVRRAVDEFVGTYHYTRIQCKFLVWAVEK